MATLSSLSNLVRHFKAENFKDCVQKFNAWKQEQEASQPKLPSVIKGDVAFHKLSKEAQANIDQLLGEFVVMAEVPLRLVEGKEFRTFCEGLNPKYHVPYIRKLKQSILQPMMQKSQDELAQKLSQCEFVSLTIDGWSSRRLLSMLGLIVNFMDTGGSLKAELLGIKVFKGKHTGENISLFITEMAIEWGILDKIVGIGSDNAANMKKALSCFWEKHLKMYNGLSASGDSTTHENTIEEDFEELIEFDDEFEAISNSTFEEATSEIFEILHEKLDNILIANLRAVGLLPIWGRCVCHLIQLSIQSYLAHPLGYHCNITEIIAKTKAYIKSCKKSSRCAEVFSEHKFSLSLMNQTRWDSMFYMIESFIKAEQKGYLKLLPSLNIKPPKKSEILILQALLDTLEPIRLFTIELQHALGTSGIVFPALDMVYKQLAEIDTEPDSPPQILSSLIRERFRPVYEDNFMKLANCLDPRFGDRTLDDPELCQKLKTCMKFVNPNMSEVSPPSEDLVISVNTPKSLFPKKSSYPHLGSNNEEEVCAYKNEARSVSDDIEANSQLWWAMHSNKFPTLYKLAKIYLIPTPSIAENERLFSIATRICSPFRSRLTGETIELLVTPKHRMMRQKQ